MILIWQPIPKSPGMMFARFATASHFRISVSRSEANSPGLAPETVEPGRPRRGNDPAPGRGLSSLHHGAPLLTSWPTPCGFADSSAGRHS